MTYTKQIIISDANPTQTLLNPWQFLPEGNNPKDWVRDGDRSTYLFKAPASALDEFTLQFRDQKGQDVNVYYDMPACLGSISVRRGRLLSRIYMGNGHDFEFEPNKTFVETRILNPRGQEHDMEPENLFAIETYHNEKDGYKLASIQTLGGKAVSAEKWQEISSRRGDFAAIARLQSVGAISLLENDRNKLKELLPDAVNYFEIFKKVKNGLSDAFVRQACPDFVQSMKKSQDDFSRFVHGQNTSR